MNVQVEPRTVLFVQGRRTVLKVFSYFYLKIFLKLRNLKIYINLYLEIYIRYNTKQTRTKYMAMVDSMAGTENKAKRKLQFCCTEKVKNENIVYKFSEKSFKHSVILNGIIIVLSSLVLIARQSTGKSN